MASFVHSPLRAGRVEIRLVALLPDADEFGDIVCRIFRAPLGTNLEYEALSYVWGSSEEPLLIQAMGSADCNGTSTKRALPVTQNLHDALRLLRSNTSNGVSRVLWVDAICIDQSNVEERSSQVALMRSIYSNASQTVVFFGPEDKFSALGMEFIKRVATTVDLDLLPEAGIWHENRKIEGHPVRQTLRELNALEEVVQLYTRPWWSRVWVVQEVTVAKKVVFYWGKQFLPWAFCARAVHALGNYMDHLVETPEFDESKAWKKINDRSSLLLSIISLSESSRHEYGLSLQELLQDFWLSDATDSRDKVYALLGLAADNHPNSIVPNYSLPMGEVYGMAMKDLILRTNNLDVLALCSGAGVRRRDGLPTWAPDWRSDGRKAKLQHGYDSYPFFDLHGKLRALLKLNLVLSKFCASGETSIETVRFNSNCSELFLRGTYADSISELTEVREYNFIGNTSFEEWLKLSDTLSQYPTGEYADLAFAKTLCANQYEVNEEDLLIEDVHSYATCMAFVTTSRKFMLTKGGLMGMAVIEAEKGDLICVVEGSRMPLILRKEGDHYLMVGEAYVHGIMYGEIYDGRFEPIQHRVEFRIL